MNELSMGLQKTDNRGKKTVLTVAGSIVVIGLAGFVLFMFAADHKINVPPRITQNFKSTIYLPTKLPGTYQIDESSIMMAEDTALIFRAKDGSGADLVFSEQPKPKDFNYDQFYKSQLESPEILNDVPYPSTWSKISQGRVTLSIVTDDTWIIMVTTAPLGSDNMQLIAQGIKTN
jgi:hypothetical protein